MNKSEVTNPRAVVIEAAEVAIEEKEVATEVTEEIEVAIEVATEAAVEVVEKEEKVKADLKEK